MLKRTIITISMFVLSMPIYSLTLSEIEKAIKLKGASWKAKSGRHFKNDRKVKERMLGAIIDERDAFATFENLDTTRFDRLPEEIDWRNKDGMNYLSSVKDQGRCGSCVSFAAIATMEAQYNIAHKFPYLDLNFSEQHLWSCDGGGCDQGWIPALAARALHSAGTTDEACSPYKSGASGEGFQCSESCSEAKKSRNYKIDDYKNVGGWFSSKEDIMEALADGPMMISMKVYEDFKAYESGVYEHVTGEYLGGHAVSLVGYNKTGNYWIVKNSWGTDFGEKGFFRIKMGDSGIGSTTYQFTIDPAEGTAKITSPKVNEVLIGTKKFEIFSSVSDTTSMELEMNTETGERHFLKAVKNSDGSYSSSFNTSGVKDGVYEARAMAITKINGKEEKNYSKL